MALLEVYCTQTDSRQFHVALQVRGNRISWDCVLIPTRPGCFQNEICRNRRISVEVSSERAHDERAQARTIVSVLDTAYRQWTAVRRTVRNQECFEALVAFAANQGPGTDAIQ
jgi:hypothetical protein